jgi:hypothetical protein
MAELALPSGGTVTIRDAKTMRAREKRILDEVFADADVSNRGEKSAAMVGRVALAKLLITAWTLPYLPGAKIPSEDPDVFDELEIPDYNLIVEKVMPSLFFLYATGVPATPDDSDKPGSPTEPSDG